MSDNSNIIIIRYETGHMIAFASGTHRRLGAQSYALRLTSELVELIFMSDPELISFNTVKHKAIKRASQVSWCRPLSLVSMGLMLPKGPHLPLEEDIVYSNHGPSSSLSTTFQFKIIISARGRDPYLNQIIVNPLIPGTANNSDRKRIQMLGIGGDTVIIGRIPNPSTTITAKEGRKKTTTATTTYAGTIQYATSLIWPSSSSVDRHGCSSNGCMMPSIILRQRVGILISFTTSELAASASTLPSINVVVRLLSLSPAEQARSSSSSTTAMMHQVDTNEQQQHPDVLLNMNFTGMPGNRSVLLDWNQPSLSLSGRNTTTATTTTSSVGFTMKIEIIKTV